MDIRNAVFDCKFCGQSDKPCEHFIAAVTDAPAPLQPTYYVRHPDDSYSVADPQPVGKAEAERWESAYKALWKDRDEQEHIRAEAQAEAERLRSLLEAAGTRIWEHHEIGHIRRAAENLTGHCEACKDDLFAKIEAALRRTGGPQE